MKNITCKIIAFLIFTTPLSAQAAEQVRDMSLSPEQTLREPSIKRSIQGDTWYDPKMAQQLRESSNDATSSVPPVNGDELSAPSSSDSSFMNKFCASKDSVPTCRESQRMETCDRFKRTAINVQQVLDRVVACDAKVQKGIEADCDGLDAGRLDLLKQYWQDEDMSYTILFLPDMVQNAAADCSIKNRMPR